LLAGRYRLLALLANGGMAAVWEGHDEVLARSVAVKVLHPHLADDRVFQERFRREAVAAARLSHPNVVATFDAGTAATGTAYIVMELVRGTTLRRLLFDRGQLPPVLAVGIAVQIADALGHAHAAGLVHRDVKPANVLLCRADPGAVPQVKVTDFGIAKAAGGVGSLDLTRTGMLMGTPGYLSPEQVEGDEPDARADLYALGVVLFEMLAGEAPFAGPNDMATAIARLNGPAPRLRHRCPGATPQLDHLVASLLARDRAARPPCAESAARSLRALDLSTPVSTVALARVPLAPSVPRRAGTRAPTPPMAWNTGAPTWQSPAPTANPGGADRLPATTGRVVGAGPATLAPDALPRGDGRGRPSGQGHDPTEVGRVPRARRRRHSPWPGRVVGVLVVLTAGVASMILFERGSPTTRSPAAIATPTVPVSGAAIDDVSVWHLERDADNAATVGYTHDGNPATMWSTDLYYGPHFAGLRHGLGLAVTLNGAHVLHQLVVDSPTKGWSAEVYVAPAVPTQISLAAWGSPVAQQSSIDGRTTFALGARDGGAVLLWITDLGPADRASIAELSVS
jgi:serine/threonine-protein kinase